ncbi:uncharacterized protein LOC127796068 isoform X1 [Diospyros lotus]|uniref:uncharacterized protein LOC127796068 isoform X1 n=1 Tax=Diospyros lotus TaxID=55363 RepID=UPI00224D86B4|nr:uncharacterized protein LOC127796068 isoform X1 [Diospyros lotus]
MVAAVPSKRWGTWEELVLGGAVLRHGTQAWSAVASELRARTLCPYSFTPEACKAKYEDLRQCYSGSTAWFEELRNRRMAELRQELEKAEDSIGSLESKLESLKAEKGLDNHVDYSASRTDSPVPLVKSEQVESSGKDASKDGLSAGSFTQDARTNWSPECQTQTTASVAEMETKPDISVSLEPKKVSMNIKKVVETSNARGGTPRKRRGKRKRKDCSGEAEECSIGESENLGSTNVVTASQSKENSTSACGPVVKVSSVSNRNRGSCGLKNDDLVGIFSALAENKAARVFQRRLDSQKRARYKKIIRQHMDFNTIRSRIGSCSIMSVKELFRDLLLLANNALVFYSKRTREYKTALVLRDTITKAYQENCNESTIRAAASPIFPLSPMYSNLPVKPRSIRHYRRKLPGKLPNAEDIFSRTKRPSFLENIIVGRAPERCKRPGNTDSVPAMESAKTVKKGSSLMGKMVRGTTNQRSKAPGKERKRAQRR